MDIEQLSVNYLPEQDRILTKIRTKDAQELRLWFTRKLTVGMWPVFCRVLDEVTAAHASEQVHVAAPDAPARAAMVDFKREETLQKADFSTPYKTEVKWTPLGPEPLLVTEVKLTAQKAGRMRLQVAEKLSNGAQPRGFDMALEQSLLHGLHQLLRQAIESAEWGLVLQPPSEQALPGEQAGDAALGNRPKYLN